MTTTHPTMGSSPGAVMLRHRSSASRSFVLASLRALHLDPSHAGGQPRHHEDEPLISDQDAYALFVMTPASGVVVPLIAST
jgi:hypothetical protein